VQRSYEDLEREGLLQSRRGKGFWVAPIPEGRKQKMAKERFADAIEKLVAHAAAEGLSDAEMRRILDKQLAKGARK
jgi:DNA-binding transcriptional regulator YhcF (GntR family)